MALTSSHPLGRIALLIAPIAVAFGVFFSVTPWRKGFGDAVVETVSLAFEILVMSCGVVVSARLHRGLNQAQRACGQTAFFVGALGGTVVMALALSLPRVRSVLIEAANGLGAGSADATGEPMVVALNLGLGALVLVQAIGTLIARAAGVGRARAA